MYQETAIIGYLGADPELRYMPDGTAVTNLSVATSRTWNDKQSGEKVQETTWFRVSVWGKMAESCNQYLAKGRMVFVKGRLKPDPQTGGPKLWTAQDGSVRASFEMVAGLVKFIGKSEEGEGAGSPARSGYESVGRYPEEEDEIPF